MAQFAEENKSSGARLLKFDETLQKSAQQNSWFTSENLWFALHQWSELLTGENLADWLSRYNLMKKRPKKTIAVVMAGNVPMAGFHDFLCVLLTGNRVLAKLSSNDSALLPFLADFLMEQAPELRDRIRFTEDKLKTFDAVIATGSGNTSRYFEYYFGKYPNIIRKNRNSVAVLSGKENAAELKALGEDVFRYFGLGCRNVSKIYVPKNYDFDSFFEAIFEFQDVILQNKYANNYDYNKAVYLMGDTTLLDNGFLVLKEDRGLASPIASLFYEHYGDTGTLREKLEAHNEDIQCVVAKGWSVDEVAFGHTQRPRLHDYADKVDTLDFLLGLH